MAHEYSKVVVVGAQGSGKSTFVGGITGIYVGTPTHCAVEWNLIPSANWSATVSVAHHKPNTSATGISFTVPQQIGEICFSPSQLISLFKRAEILTIYPGIDMAHILTLNEGAIGRILASTSRICSGMIYIALKYPGVLLTKEITIVDVPGVARRGTAEKTIESVYVQQLVSECCSPTSGRVSVAVILPLDVDSEQGNQALSFAKSIDEGLSRTILIFNHLDSSSISPWSVKASQQHQCFFIHLSPECFPRPQFSFLETGIECLRQEEAAFFRLCEPWASRSERGNLGVANILKWCLPNDEPLSQYWFRQLLGELYKGLQTVVYDTLRYLKRIVLALLAIYVVLCLVVVVYYLEDSAQ